MKEDVSEHLSEVTIPTLIIAGEKDEVNPVARMEEEVRAKLKGQRW